MPEIVSSDAVNKVGSKPVVTRSSFPIGYNLLNTLRFGEYSPHYVAEGVPNDSLPLRCSHDVRSLNLKSPLLQDIQLKKDYFQVPMESILPLNWDKIQTNPLRGDDVDAQTVGCSVADFPTRIKSVADYLYAKVGLSGNDDSTNFTWVLRYMLFCEMFYSRGSLASTLGLHLTKQFYCVKTSDSSVISFDKWFDIQFSYMKNLVSDITFTSNGNTYYVKDSIAGNLYANNIVTWRQALCIMRENMDFVITNGTYNSAFTANPFVNTYTFSIINAVFPVNLARFFAYQLVCAHFYSNDKIDYIYSAELYRELIGSYRNLVGGTAGVQSNFQYNGLYCFYDHCSAYVFNQMCYRFISGAIDVVVTTSILPYFRAIFGYNRSLRYEDYFTGSRSQPLAVGDVNVAVSNNNVSVIDVTRKIQVQKFLNQVNRIGRKTSEYVKGLFNVSQDKDYHEPLWLAHTNDVIFGSEVENTGVAQQSSANSTTSVLRSNASKYEFNVHLDRFSIIIGVSYFDIKRAYANTVDRTYFHVNRFDMFNPYLQFVGDQSVYKTELDASLPLTGSFGYQQRYAEYKNRLDVCAGGIVDYLPTWAFVAPNSLANAGTTIDPDFIRSWQTELDEFYSVLSNYSLGGYFHFIVKSVNNCDASRPMAFAPSIL